MKALTSRTKVTVALDRSLSCVLCLVLFGALTASVRGVESADEVLSPSALEAAVQWLSAESREDRPAPSEVLNSPALTRAQVQGVRQVLWQAYQNSARSRTLAALLPDPFVFKANDEPRPQACRLTTGAKVMPFYFVGKGDLPEKRPLFIALHGGGSAGGRAPSAHGWSVNTREWRTQLRLCAQIYPDNALYFIPRMADDNDGRWYYHYCQDAYDQVVRAAILHHQVDPNRVYLNDHLLDLDKPVRVSCNGKTGFEAVLPRKASVMLRSLAERGDPSYMFPAQATLPVQAKVERQGSDKTQKLLAQLPQTDARYVARLLQGAGGKQDEVAAALLALPEDQRSAALTLLSLLPEAELRTVSLPALTQQVKTLAPVLAQVTERRQQRELAQTLLAAGENRAEILKTIQSAREEHKKATLFLITNMPQRDLASLTADFLTENTTLAYRAWQESPWHERIPEQLFLQYILPYVHLNERRDNWRRDFMKRLQAKAWSYASPMEATIWLNNELNDLFKVYFHATRRPKADQSPYESIEAGYASCTGLSILLADACRSVGIPARLVGIPQWTEVRGNHNWVEIWDGQWHNVGGTGSDPRDDDWVNQRCLTQTDPDQWRHAVYAACFRQTRLRFPLVWDLSIDYVPALNVTRFYSLRQTTQIDIPKPGPAWVEVMWAGELIARIRGEEQVNLTLARGSTYQIRIVMSDGQTHEEILRL